MMVTANAVRRRGKPPWHGAKCCVNLVSDANSAPVKISVVGQLESPAAELFEQQPAGERRVSFDANYWWAVCTNAIRSFGKDTGMLANVNGRIMSVRRQPECRWVQPQMPERQANGHAATPMVLQQAKRAIIPSRLTGSRRSCYRLRADRSTSVAPTVFLRWRTKKTRCNYLSHRAL